MHNMYDFQQFRNIMAGFGYEFTPDQAKIIWESVSTIQQGDVEHNCTIDESMIEKGYLYYQTSVLVAPAKYVRGDNIPYAPRYVIRVNDVIGAAEKVKRDFLDCAYYSMLDGKCKNTIYNFDRQFLENKKY